ncbi:MAG TPA: lasso RiPP family leader peptide-containing protein [Xanthomonadales bacterium]|nr:lasso RiPP family leader peptide-containing protein [Xanthomonadales bacterium]
MTLPQCGNQDEERARAPYERPALVWLGDLRELTLGASPGLGDSGGGSNFKCPGCP